MRIAAAGGRHRLAGRAGKRVAACCSAPSPHSTIRERESRSIALVAESPAAQAGLQPGDVILQLDDQKIADLPGFSEAPEETRAESDSRRRAGPRRRG